MQKLLPILLIFLGTVLPVPTHGYYTPETFTLNGNHPAPKSFTSDGAGGFWGLTTDNRTFTQKPVTNNFNLKLHKFVIDDAYFYISDRGAFLATSDLAALSIYYSLDKTA